MITGIGHLAFCVNDLETSLDFYCNKMGFRRIFHLGEEANPWLVYIRVAHHQYIELFPASAREQYEKQTYSHLCLAVTEIQKVVDDLRGKGVAVDDVKLGHDGNYQAWLADPDGNRIELMELLPDSIQSRLDTE